MPRPAKKDMVRLNLVVNKKTRKTLDDLKERLSADTLSEVVRRSLLLYDFLTEDSDGEAVEIFMKKNDEPEKHLLFIP